MGTTQWLSVKQKSHECINMIFNSPSSILDFLSINSIKYSAEAAYVFYDAEDVITEINFCQLKEKVDKVSSGFSKISAEPKSRVLIVIPPGIDFIVSFLGSLAAGMIAVPTFPPNNSRKLDRLKSIKNDCRTKYILCSKMLAANLASLTSNGEQVIYIEDLILEETEKKTAHYAIKPEDIAFLQYTSGSTGLPKGVCISHGNIVNNLSLIQNVIPVPNFYKKQTLVTWLPPYHDMGLIFGILFPLFKGITCHFMAPQSFIKSPYKWLKLISDTKATITGAPNFAFDLCTHGIPKDKLPSLDLSSLQIVFNGAEPISLKTLEQFFEKFFHVGLNPEVLYPAYGLAESTLFVTSRSGIKVNSYQNIGVDRKLVSCGYKDEAHDIKIIDPETLTLCELYEEGEIWIDGPSVAQGYWEQEELTKTIFHAKYQGSDRTYLRTGDLGFFDGEENLYVSGRIKDLIIINGQNIYPQDIEELAQISHPSLVLQGTAAFVLADSEKSSHEKLCIVQEVHRHSKDLDLLENLIRKNIYESYEIAVDNIVFIREKSIPRTTSGKIQRQKCKDLFLNNELSLVKEKTREANASIALFDEENDILKCIHNNVAFILNQDLQVNFFEKTLIQLGFDSIKVSFLKAHLEEKLNIDVPFSLFFSNLNIKEIADFLSKNKDSIGIKPTVFSSVGSYSLASLQQQKLWFLNDYVPYKQMYNLPIKIEMNGDISEESIKNVLEKIISRHEVLRTGFEELEELIIQKPVDKLEIEFIFKNISNLSESQAEKEIKDIEYNFSSFKFNLNSPGLFKTCLIKHSEEKYYLLLNFHHIIFDGHSLKLFLREFSTIYNSITESEEFLMPTTHSTYINFSDTQRSHLSGQFLEKHISFWTEYLKNSPSFSRYSIGSENLEKFTYRGAVEVIALPTDLTHNLSLLAKNNNITFFTLLIAAYYVLLFSKTGQTDLIVGIPMSGRTNSYAANVIGLVMNILPVRIILSEDNTLEEILNKVNKLILDVQDHQHIPFDLLIEYLHITRILDVNPLYQTLFTFREDWALDLNLKGIETSISEITTGYTKLDLSFFVQQKQSSLELQIEYAIDLFEREEILNLLNKYQNILNSFITNPKLALKRLLDISQIKNISAKSTPFSPENHISSSFNNQIDKDLYNLWSELLGKKEIKLDDNFFQLGGHSLLLNRMILRLKKDFGYVISIREAFANPTIASLSKYIKAS